MASLYLTDIAKNLDVNKDSLKLGVIQAFRADPILDGMPWTDIGDLKMNFLRAKSMPQPDFRKIGNAYTSSKSDMRPGEERIYLLGQDIDVDKALINIKNTSINRRTWEREMALNAMKRTFRYYLVNGDPTSDEDGFTGLWYRLVNNSPATQSIDADGLDLTGDLSVAATRNAAINKLEELIDACNEGDCDAVLMDRVTKVKYDSIFRFSGLLATNVNHLGQKFSRYGDDKGPLLISMGYHRDETDLEEGTKVIGHDEASDGSALTNGDGCTSMYAVKFGKDQLGGIQEYALQVTDKGELEDGVTYRDVVDWPLGISTIRPRCIARLFGITAKATGS